MSGVEILDNGTRVLTAPRAAFGTDALLLGRFAQPRRAERALDMCSGCGIISLLWHDAGHRGPCTALELDPDASALCVQAVAENGIDHITPVQDDLRMFCAAGPEQGKYDFVACNPPYFTAGPQSPDPVRAAARHTVTCTTEDVAQCARRALRDGGRFVLCQRPDNWWKCCVPCAPPAGTQATGLCAPAHRQHALAVLVEAQKGRKPGLKLEPDILIESGVARYGK